MGLEAFPFDLSAACTTPAVFLSYASSYLADPLPWAPDEKHAALGKGSRRQTSPKLLARSFPLPGLSTEEIQRGSALGYFRFYVSRRSWKRRVPSQATFFPSPSSDVDGVVLFAD